MKLYNTILKLKKRNNEYKAIYAPGKEKELAEGLYCACMSDEKLRDELFAMFLMLADDTIGLDKLSELSNHIKKQ